MAQAFLALIFWVHQFLFSTSLEGSFEEPKWVWFTLSFLVLWLGVQWLTRKSPDLQYPRRSILVLWALLLIPLLIDGLHGSRFFLHSVGFAALCYSLPYLMHRTQVSISRVAPALFLVIFAAALLEWLGLMPFVRGPLYHLSGFVGNPNLLGACLVFWFWIARDRVKSKNLFFLICLCGTLLTLSRAAVLALLICEAWRRFREGQRALFLLVLAVALFCAAYSIKNPHQVREFSSLKIRQHEITLSLEILKENWLLGIGQGAYRHEFYRRLDGKFEGVDSYQDRPGLEWIRLSSSSHQSVLSVFLWLGLPFGLLFLGLLCWWIRFCFPSFSKGERLALGSALLMSQVYDLMSFGVFSLPVVFVIARGASERLSPSDTSTSRRWLPLVGLVIWAGYWVGVTHHSVQRQEANTIDEFRQLVDSPFVSGEDYHRFARWMLSSARGFVEKEDFQHILSEAHRRTPDPSTLYHRAMAAKNEGERDSAKNWLIKGIETLPTFAPYYYGLALLAQTSQEEERRYLQALQVDNSHYQAWKNLGILLFERGDFQRSAYAFKQGKKAFLKKKGMNLDSTDRFYLNQLEEGLNKAGKMRDQEQKSK